MLTTLALFACSSVPATGLSYSTPKPTSSALAEVATIRWGDEIVLSGDDGAIHKSFCNANTIVVDQNGNVHAVWYAIEDGFDKIHYRRSLDDGLTWEEDTVIATGPNVVGEVTLTATSGHEFVAGNNTGANPAIAASGTNLYVVWRSDQHSNLDAVSKTTNGEIYFIHSTDSGSTWEPEVRLTKAEGDSIIPVVATFGDRVVVTWIDLRDGNSDLYLRASNDNGVTWSDEVRVTNSIGSKVQPSISIHDEDILIFWMDDQDGNWEIYYGSSQDGGKNWAAPVKFTDDPGVSEVPVVARSGDDIHVVWTDSRTTSPDEHYIDAYEIYYRRSNDGGATWSEEIRLTDAPKWSADPSISVLGSDVYVFWPDRRDMPGSGREDDREIYYKYSNDGGVTWSDDMRLTNSIGESGLAAVAQSKSSLHVLWEDTRSGRSEIFYRRGVLLDEP